MKHNASPVEMIASLWRNRKLFLTLVQREVVGRYKGSYMGIVWSFLNPLFMLSVYTFVFGEIFNSRWSGGVGSKTEFALVVFIGLIIFNLYAECINQAPSLILGNSNYVKKVVFPLELLPWVTMGSALFHFFISLTVWLIAYSVLNGVPKLTMLMFPIVLFPFVLLVMGLNWLLSALGVFLRDIGQVIGIFTLSMMFLSPLFFPISSLPLEYQSLIQLNPLTVPIEQMRELLIWGRQPNFAVLGIYMAVATVVASVGFFVFQKSRKGFADVL